MTFAFDQTGVSYLFECRPLDVAITELGLTGLMDVTTGTKMSDTPASGSTLVGTAASMGLYTDRVKPLLVAAVAKPSSAKGWDLTITLPKKDAAFRSLTKAKSMSLMSTGWTGLVQLGPADQKVIAAFVEACRPS